MPVITISSSFGSAGSVVAAELADTLEWKLLNRAITVEVATQLAVPLELAEAYDERAESGWRRILGNLAKLSSALPESAPALDVTSDEERVKVATERVLRAAAQDNVVIVGRAAAIVLRGLRDTLHVRLDGPREARLKQGAAALGISLAEAETRLGQTDRARAAYVKELYGLDWQDPSLYDAVLDSTVFPIKGCAAIILAAARGRFGDRGF